MGQIARDEALASLRAYLMAQDERIVDVKRGTIDYREIPWAKDVEDHGGLYLSAIFKDPRIPERGYAGMGLSADWLDYVGDTSDCARMILPGGDSIAAHNDEWIKAWVWYIVGQAIAHAVEAYLERGRSAVMAPQFLSGILADE